MTPDREAKAQTLADALALFAPYHPIVTFSRGRVSLEFDIIPRTLTFDEVENARKALDDWNND